MSMDKMDIVLQGKCEGDTEAIAQAYLKLPFVNNIIVSCWENDNVYGGLLNERIIMVRSKYPPSNGTDNRNLQITSSLAGLLQVKTKFSAKMRSDQQYNHNSMMLMYEYFKNNFESKTIFVAGMFPNLLFHPRDHVFWGETVNLLALFDIPLEVNGYQEKHNLSKEQLFHHYNQFTRSETYIGAKYIAKFEPEVRKLLEKEEDYLYDKAKHWNIAKEISDRLTGRYFKPFPRKGVDLMWHRKGWFNYPYENQKRGYGECWAEDTKENTMNNTLNEAIAAYARSPEDPEKNYTVACLYDELGQTAGAISYFLRTAERTEDKNLAYESLLRVALCFDKQGGRANTVRGVFQQALMLLPQRPEAYFLLARFYERANDHPNGYMYAQLGIKFSDSNQIPLRNSVEYPGYYGLIFEKAVCSWWWGKPDECRKLLQLLKNEYKMDDIHTVAVQGNIERTMKK